MSDRDEIIITSSTAPFLEQIRDIVKHRQLLTTLIWRNIATQFTQTLLGPLWFIVQPLLTIVVFTFVFNRVIHLPTGNVSPPLFYLCGLTLWGYLVRCIQLSSSSLQGHKQIFERVYFPRILVPTSLALSNLYPYLIQLTLFLGLYCLIKSPAALAVSLKTLWIFPFLVLETGLLALGIGLWFSALSVRHRDLLHLLAFLTHLWLYVTPVFYPFSLVPDPWQRWLALNPMVYLMEAYRAIFFGSAFLPDIYGIVSVLITAVIFVTGVLVFTSNEKNLIDHL